LPGSASVWPADLLRAGDLTCVGLEALIDLAGRMKAEPAEWSGALAGRTLGCRFELTSVRARASVEVAGHRLGMLPLELDADEFPLDGREPVAEIARLLVAQSGDVLVVTTSQKTLRTLARAADVPILNALSDEEDPCQAIADLLTLRERAGDLEGHVLAYVGEPGPVAHSLMEAGALMGMDVRVACPPARRPPIEMVGAAEIIADRHSGSITVTDDPLAAVTGADAVCTDVWASPVSPGELEAYRVTPRLMAHAKPDALFLHSLPAHRGEEVSAAVIDGPHSVVAQQAANRVPAEQAAIYVLAGARQEEAV
jgi:ornithine carbamoyltransferase